MSKTSLTGAKLSILTLSKRLVQWPKRRNIKMVLNLSRGIVALEEGDRNLDYH